MAKTLRTLSDPDFTTKGSTLTFEEVDQNFIDIWNNADASLKASNDLSDLNSAAIARQNLGVDIGVDVQGHNDRLDDIAGLAVSDSNIIVGNGTNWVAESGSTARASLGLSIGSDVQAYDSKLANFVSSSLSVSGTTISSTGDITLNPTGDVFINGDTIQIDKEMTTTDNIVVLNSGEGGSGVTAGTSGLQVDRGSLTDYQFMFRESDDSFVIGEIGSLQTVATREDSPSNDGLAFWDNSTVKFETSSSLTFDGSTLDAPAIDIGGSAFVDSSRNVTANGGTFTGNIIINRSSTSALIDLDSGVGSDSIVRFKEDGTNKAQLYYDASTSAISLFDSVNAKTAFSWGLSSEVFDVNGTFTTNDAIFRGFITGDYDGAGTNDQLVFQTRSGSLAQFVDSTGSGTILAIRDNNVIDAFAEVNVSQTFTAQSDISAEQSIGIGTTPSGTAGELDVAATATFQDNIVLSATGQDLIESSTFTAGFGGDGFKLFEQTGLHKMELDDMFIRGALFVYELIINQVSAVNGSEIMSPGRGKVDTVTGTAPSEVVEIADPEGSNFSSFAADDIVLIQQVDLDDTTVVKRIVRKVSSVTGNSVTLTSLSGAPADAGSIEESDIMVAIGNTTNTARQAAIYRSVVDSGAPFTSVRDGVSSWADWTGTDKEKMRYGNLAGSYGYSSATDIYGIGMGDAAGDHVTIDPTNGVRFKDASDNIAAQFTGSLFKLGDGTNYVEFNASTSSIDMAMDTFNLTSNALTLQSGANAALSVGSMSFGLNVESANDGIFIDTNNYWYDDGAWKIGGGTNYLIHDGAGGVDANLDTFTLAANGLTIDNATGIVIGSDFWKNDNTFSFGGGILTGTSSSVTAANWELTSTTLQNTDQTTNIYISNDNTRTFNGLADGSMNVGRLNGTYAGIILKADANNYISSFIHDTGYGDFRGVFQGNTIFNLVTNDVSSIAGANFDADAFYSTNNSKTFKGSGLYINWTDEDFSLGSEFYYDSSLNEVGIAGWTGDTSKLYGGNVVGEFTGLQSGSGTTKAFFAGADDSTGTNHKAAILANGKIDYDGIGGSIYSAFNIATYNNNASTADSLIDDAWQVNTTATGTGTGTSDITKVRGRFYKKFGVDTITIQGKTLTDYNIVSGTFNTTFRIEAAVKDSQGGSTVASNNYTTSPSASYSDFTLDVDVSSLSDDTYYILEIDLYVQLDGSDLNSGSDEASVTLYLREDLFITSGA